MDFNENNNKNLNIDSNSEQNDANSTFENNAEYSKRSDEIIQNNSSAMSDVSQNVKHTSNNGEFISGEKQSSTDVREYPSYDQWQQKKGDSSSSFDEIYGNFQKPKKDKSNGAVKIIVSCIVAVMLFTAGVLLGESQFDINNDILDNSVVEDDISQSNSNSPTLNIKSKDGSEDGLSGVDVYAKAAPSIVGIKATSLINNSSNSGSGIIMTEDGYIITNNHVIENADKLTVVLNDNTQYEAEIIGADKKTDLAVLKITPNTALIPAEFGDSDQLVVGSRAYAIGSPGGLELQNTFTGGFISAINRDITIDDRVMTLLQTDASINPGNSGGALINEYGQIIGITTAKLGVSYYEGLGFAIPINSAKEIVDELITNGYISGRPSIGLSGYNISEMTAKNNNVPQGVLIALVDTRSDAYNKGVKKGDIIIGVNGKTIKDMKEVNAVKEQFKAGDSITLNIYRAGKKIEIEIKLVDEADLTVETTNDNIPNPQNPEFGNGDNGGNNKDNGTYYYEFPFGY